MAMTSGVLGLRTSRTSRTRVAATSAAADLTSGAGTRSLADLGRGQTGVVVGIHDGGDPAVARRLVDLGFAPGTEVRMLRRAPLQDPVVFRVAGYDIALRGAQARCIKVDAAR